MSVDDIKTIVAVIAPAITVMVTVWKGINWIVQGINALVIGQNNQKERADELDDRIKRLEAWHDSRTQA